MADTLTEKGADKDTSNETKKEPEKEPRYEIGDKTENGITKTVAGYRFVKAAFRRILGGTIQLLFPLRCPVCDKIVVPYGEKICLDCLRKLQVISAPWCMRCGKKIISDGLYCNDCLTKEHIFDRGRSLYEYHSVAPSVYRMKYGGRQEYAAYFGEEMAENLGDFIRQVNPDGFIPVPLHKKRLRQRGYNQAALLAKAVGRATDIPVYEHYLGRIKYAPPLKNQNPKERENNLKNAFIIKQNDVKLNTIIIIDDIYTTGSTMDEIAAVLKRAGVKNVYFMTLANGEGI